MVEASRAPLWDRVKNRARKYAFRGAIGAAVVGAAFGYKVNADAQDATANSAIATKLADQGIKYIGQPNVAKDEVPVHYGSEDQCTGEFYILNPNTAANANSGPVNLYVKLPDASGDIFGNVVDFRDFNKELEARTILWSISSSSPDQTTCPKG